MQLYCPKCRAAVQAIDRCPRCDSRLVTPAELFASASTLGEAKYVERPKPSALTRVALGVLVALGVTVGLREMVMGWFTLLADDQSIAEAVALALATMMRAVGAAVGGALAGAGRPRGFLPGAAVGLVAGGMLLGADVLGGLKPTNWHAAAVAGLTVAAALAGWAATHVWTPLADVPPPTRASALQSSFARLVEKPDAGRPTNWVRVGLGVAVAVVAVTGADLLRASMQKATAGVLRFGSPAHVPLIDFGFAAAAVVGAGVIAGGNTGVGWRQGLLMGLFVGALLVVMVVSDNPAVLLPVEGWLDASGRPDQPPQSVGSLLSLFAAAVAGGVLGGSFGGVLLPTLGKPAARVSPV